MTDILSALDTLEQLEKEQRPKAPKNKKGKGKAPQQKRQSRPRSLPVPRNNPSSQSNGNSARSADASSVRSVSQAPSSRRISFAEPARPSATSKRIWIPTAKNSLSSGFQFDPRLQKYGVAEGIWERFSREIVELCDVPEPGFMWPFHKKKVIESVRREMQYGGDLQRKWKTWNKVFKNMGFQTELALPGEHLEDTTATTGEDGEPELKNPNAKRDGKRFRVIITPNAEKAMSVYSRTSSLTRSVSGEGANLQAAAAASAKTDDQEPEETEESKEGQEAQRRVEFG